MTDGEDQVGERAERALRTAFQQRGHAYEPVDLNPAGLRAPSRKGRLLRSSSAAAAVILVASGATLSVGWWANHNSQGQPGGSIASNVASNGPAANASQVHAENQRREQEAGREAERVLASMPTPNGANRVRPADVPPLTKSATFLDWGDQPVTRSGFWLVAAQPRQLAQWYALNPPPGMTPEGGSQGVGGGRNTDGSWSQQVIYDATRTGPASHSSALVQVTPIGNRAGVRITVYTSWSPARPLQSFAPHDVTAIQIVVVHNGQRQTTTVDSATDIAPLVHAYNALAGAHTSFQSCPYVRNPTQYQMTFVSATREISAVSSGSCDTAWHVTLDGKPIDPPLAHNGRLTSLIVQAAN
jgi:hypothetical protein